LNTDKDAYRTLREAGIDHDPRLAAWLDDKEERIDRWLFWLAVAAIPLLCYRLYWIA
jgi:phosphohistidine phosphatase SixA